MKTFIHAAALASTMSAALTTTAMSGENTMDEKTILHTIETMTSAFAAGDIDTVLSTYESGAVVMAAPGSPVSGNRELRRMFEDFVASGVNFTYGAHEVVVAGDLGLHFMRWTAPGPQGDQSALSVAVLRRQVDGSWKMMIDHPFGDAVMLAGE